MKRLVLVLMLAPITLSAQVVIDTVVRGLPSRCFQSYFIPELNKLYMCGRDRFIVLDCSTYQVKTQILTTTGSAHYAWNWRRHKLYVDCNPRPDSTYVIDAVADSIVGWISGHRDIHSGPVYLSDLDRVYKPEIETMYVFDCAADTVVRKVVPPVGFAVQRVTWDSVNRRLLCGGVELGQAKLAVYDYVADSFTKVMNADYGSGLAVFAFNSENRRAIVGPDFVAGPGGWAGLYDCERDTVLRMLPFLDAGVPSQVGIDQRDGKAYIAGVYRPDRPDTLWIVDMDGDSILKSVVYARRGYGPYQTARGVRWIPWSNRVYISCWRDLDEQTLDSSIIVLDCNTDSIIVPGLPLGHWGPSDIQLDPIRQRIIVVGADSGMVHFLRDTGYASVAEPRPARPRTVSDLQLRMTPGGYEVSYSLASPCRADVSVYDLMGRELRKLVTEQQPAGRHSAIWDRRDRAGAAIAPGVYFIRLQCRGLRDGPNSRTSSIHDVKKAVVLR
jgi:hypothetical protein